jgi:DNA repair protein RecO (recombination protein O)
MERCEGIVLRQIKASGHRRMILILTDRLGKISAGTSISEGGKSRSALAIRPFSHSLFHLSTRKEHLNITSAETLGYFHGIGADAEKFLQASRMMELMGRMIPEGAPAEEYYRLLLCYLRLSDGRKKAFGTLTASCLVKALQLGGVLPERENFHMDELLSGLNFDIVRVLVYLMEQPLEKMEHLALDEEKCNELLRVIRRYVALHLDVGPLKSDLSMEL